MRDVGGSITGGAPVAVGLLDPITLYSCPNDVENKSVHDMVESLDFHRFLASNLAQWNLKMGEVKLRTVDLHFSPPITNIQQTTVAQWRGRVSGADVHPVPTILLHLNTGDASRDQVCRKLEKAEWAFEDCIDKHTQLEVERNKIDKERKTIKI